MRVVFQVDWPPFGDIYVHMGCQFEKNSLKVVKSIVSNFMPGISWFFSHYIYINHFLLTIIHFKNIIYKNNHG